MPDTKNININYTNEELALITEISKSASEMDVDQAAELLLKFRGNMSFNKKLRLDLAKNTQDNLVEQTKQMLAYYTVKTRDYEKSLSLLHKLKIVLQHKEKGNAIEKFEKISLQEFPKIESLSQPYRNGVKWRKTSDSLDVLDHINKKTNSEDFKEMFAQMKDVSTIMSTIIYKKSLSLSESSQYKSGDIAMYLTKKSSMKRDKQKWLAHGGKLEEILVTKYNHAAPIYIDNIRSEKPVVNKSDIWSNQRDEYLTVQEVIDSDIFRIDPVKLVNKKQRALLEQMDYGYKNIDGKNVKLTWQEKMRGRYESLSSALHTNLTQNLYEVKVLMAELNEKGITDERKQQIIDKISEKSTTIIINDGPRIVNSANWLSPVELIKGHKKFFAKNNYRDLSEKMFSASPEEKKMICSEFAARSISAVIYELNKITALELQKNQLIDKERQIIKQPIPKRENFQKIHPERLVKLLKDSGAAEQVHNEFLSSIIQTENTKRVKLQHFEGLAALPEKIYAVLKHSKDQDEFKQNASKSVETYLNVLNIEDKVIDELKQGLNQDLEAIYQERSKQPRTVLEKISKVCTKILEFCKLRTKDKTVKASIEKLKDNIAKHTKTKNVDPKSLQKNSKKGKGVQKTKYGRLR